MRIAIVGAGVSGLVTAHLLHRTHDITVFEAGAYAGGHTNTVAVETEAGVHHVDTGFIVFNDRNYPRFERLLQRLDVAWQPSSMTFSVSDEHGDFEYNGSSPNGLFAKRAHLVTPWFHRMVADLVRFNREARRLLASREDPVAARLARGPRLLARLRRAADRAAGRRRLVGRPGADVALPGPLPGRVLRQPRHARLHRPPALAHDQGRLAPLRRGAHRAAARRCGSTRRSARSRATRTYVDRRRRGASTTS